jgi:hypothetical protein
VSLLGTVVTFEPRIVGQASGGSRTAGQDRPASRAAEDQSADGADDDTSVISDGGLVGTSGPHQSSRSRHGTD